MQTRLHAAAMATVIALSTNAHADDVTRADSHAPIGVMADHFHKRGEWMFSYRFMSMDMAGNRDGDDRIAPDTIVTTVPNRFAGQPMQPPTLRVAPLDMRMDMHMFGAMYAPTDRVTLMAMVNYHDRTMDHRTYMGGMGTTVLGDFTTETSGIGDTQVAALVSLIDTPQRKLHAIAGLSLPTGSHDETAEILTPMNMRPTVRLPYPMQLGSGSVDPVLGLSWQAYEPGWSWGAQWRSTVRVADNDDDYRLGDEHRLTGWIARAWTDAVSTSLRLEHYRRGNISGQDAQIVAPVQTADPDRQGVSRTDLGLGINLAGSGGLHGYRVALEYLVPVAQDLDGPQLETDAQLVFGLQKSF